MVLPMVNFFFFFFFCGEDLEMVRDITSSHSELMVECSFKEILL